MFFYYLLRQKIKYPCCNFLAKDNQKVSKLFRKGLEGSAFWNEFKAKCEDKNTTNKYRYFLKSNFIWVNWLFINKSRCQFEKIYKTRRYYFTKDIIKNYNVIIKQKKLLWPKNWFRYKLIWANEKTNNRTRWRLH